MTNPSGSKKSLSSDVTVLRKQVNDLKEAAIERRRVEAAVRASEELYRAVVEELPLPILRLDGRGKTQVANPALIARLGYASKQDFHTIGELRGIFADDDECHRVLALAGDGEVTRIESQCRLRDGSIARIDFLVGRTKSPDAVTLLIAP